uniref:Putative structural protein n=1 Tax=viral metagenome TaxID=1070528 RepID=A0A6H1ZFX7_9ZZZZ
MFTRGRFNNEYLPGLFMLAIDSYENKRVASMWPELVTIKTSKKSKEEDVLRSGLSTLRAKGEGAPVTYDTQIAGPKQTWVHGVKALAVRITEEAIDDNLYELSGGSDGSLKELFLDLGEAAEETIESEISRFFNSATATTYHTTRFGYALAYATHPRLDGSTYSNYATSSDLTYSTFWANLIAAENQYDHRQHRIMKKVKNLWVAPNYEQKALEILKSTDRPDTANRAVSAYAKSGRNIDLKVWRHMTDTDSWIMQLEGRGIIFFWNRKTRFARDKDFQTGDVMVKVDQRWSAEIADEQCFYCVIPA